MLTRVREECCDVLPYLVYLIYLLLNFVWVEDEDVEVRDGEAEVGGRCLHA